MTKNTQTQTQKKTTSALVNGTITKAGVPALIAPQVKGAFTSNRLLHQQVLESVSSDSPLRLTFADLPNP